MRTLQADATNDLTLDGAGNLALLEGAAAAEQTARQYGQTRRREMIHAMDLGIPFELLVWGGTPNVAQYEAVLRARLLQVPEVTAVIALSARQDGDTLSYSATLETTAGEVTISG